MTTSRTRVFSLYAVMFGLFMIVGLFQSWNLSLAILNLCLISAIMSQGVNIQWGYAGLFNAGIMGFAALGGLAAVIVSHPPVIEAWQAGSTGLLVAGLTLLATLLAIRIACKKITNRRLRTLTVALIVALGLIIIRQTYLPATEAIEAINPTVTGFLGGLGLPILLSWLAGGLLAAGAAWCIGRITLGLRSDYLAIATLGISEILIAIIKNEDWLTRGVKNVIGLPRPVPLEIELQQSPWFMTLANRLGGDIAPLSGIFVKLCYAGLFFLVLLLIIMLSERSLNSPWGRMMLAIRDNEDAARALGKDVVHRRLQVFILGSMVIGIAGAMLTTLDGQLTPVSYQPMRFTFLIWVMTIVGGSGNNRGAVLGGFLVWFTWVEAEPAGIWLVDQLTSIMANENPIRQQLLQNAAHMRHIAMGVILLVVIRWFPRGLLPGK
ncbi:MAG: branched-chain amino acid ABC transporter permease [Rhodobacteraceae bacterium]|nr:branched-chain amino acid ABC transporter permease [Paracoccaceae bacterium]